MSRPRDRTHSLPHLNKRSTSAPTWVTSKHRAIGNSGYTSSDLHSGRTIDHDVPLCIHLVQLHVHACLLCIVQQTTGFGAHIVNVTFIRSPDCTSGAHCFCDIDEISNKSRYSPCCFVIFQPTVLYLTSRTFCTTFLVYYTKSTTALFRCARARVTVIQLYCIAAMPFIETLKIAPTLTDVLTIWRNTRIIVIIQ